MSDDRAYDAEAERLIAECKHTGPHDLVCITCGMPAPAPIEGYDRWNGEWYDEETALD